MKRPRKRSGKRIAHFTNNERENTMQNLLSLKEFRTGNEIVTIAELDDASIDRARDNGWTLCAVFSAERRPSRYGEDKTITQLLGIFSLPTDQVVVNAVSRADKAEKDRAEAEQKRWKAQEEAKRSFEVMMQAKNELEVLRLKIPPLMSDEELAGQGK